MEPIPPSMFIHCVMEGCDIIKKEDLAASISKLGGEISDLKFRVKEVIEDTYVDFTILAQEHFHLLSKAKSLTKEIDDLSHKVTNHTTSSLKESTSELKELSTSMQRVSLISANVNQLLQFNALFKAIDKLRTIKEYGKIASTLLQIRTMLEESSDTNSDLEIFKALTAEYTSQSDSFLDEICNTWKDCIKLEDTLSEDVPHLQVHTLQIDILRVEEISQLFCTLNIVEHLTLYFKRFADWILKSIFLPIIVQGSVASLDKNEKYASLSVEVDPSKQKHCHKKVFVNLLIVFQFFHSILEVDSKSNIKFLTKLGEVIDTEFCKMLVEHCLSATIPNHSSKLDDYKAVVADATDFQSKLIEIGFLQESYQPLLDYTGNVEYLCANKTCRNLLDKAREIMKKDLYDMMEVGITTDGAEIPATQVDNMSSIKPERTLSNHTFQFPKCRISKSAFELQELMGQVLTDCVASTDICAVRLFYTARNIVELYCAVVPTHHQKFLETIPQQVALFHNNCMYLSHCLLILGDEHRHLLPEVLKSHLITFVDQVTELRTFGTSIFLDHMQMQRNQILDIVRNCGLTTLSESSNLTLGTEKALRQCIRQLELLQSVWHPVLPEHVYCKAIGCLVNSLVDELITRVVALEDIPADTATHLIEMFKVVATRTPKVFQVPKEIHRHVKKWDMFLELVLILGASLRDINDRWADGKGPIALLFQAEQVKQLIRALFQNTERRSNVLARIR